MTTTKTTKPATVTTAAAIRVLRDAIAAKYDPMVVTTWRAMDTLTLFASSLTQLGVQATAQELPVEDVSVPQALAALGNAIREAYRPANSERAYDAGRKLESLRIALMTIGVATVAVDE